MRHYPFRDRWPYVRSTGEVVPARSLSGRIRSTATTALFGFSNPEMAADTLNINYNWQRVAESVIQRWRCGVESTVQPVHRILPLNPTIFAAQSIDFQIFTFLYIRPIPSQKQWERTHRRRSRRASPPMKRRSSKPPWTKRINEPPISSVRPSDTTSEKTRIG